ncbi:MAG TPA: hypothetical protein VL285_20760 [Bryobacteraceae bacterium]|jgi:hypothetical protein|nr:hypothetical protein [Bryobacteraceae bacterium]
MASHQECLDYVVDVDRISYLAAVTVNFQRSALAQTAHERAEESLAWNIQSHAWTVHVGQPEDAGVEPPLTAEQQVIRAGRIFVNPIEIDWLDGMILVDRQASGYAVDLPRPRVNQANARVPPGASLEEPHLAPNIDLEIPFRIQHALVVPDFTGEIEDYIRGTNRVAEDLGFSHVHWKPADVTKAFAEIVRIPSATRHAGIDDGYFRPRLEQGQYQIAAKKP